MSQPGALPKELREETIWLYRTTGKSFREILDKQDQSDVFFIQAVRNNFNGAEIGTPDGMWGDHTQTARINLNQAWNFNLQACQVFVEQWATAESLNHVMRTVR